MRIKYGNYQHSDGECTLVFSQRAVFLRGIRFATTKIATITGTLLGTQSTLGAQILALENAYNVNGRDFGLFTDGGTATPHTILSRLTIGGTRVTDFNWIDGPAEYATGRSYQITIEGDYLDPANGNRLVAYTETISLTGNGGPATVHLTPQIGLPVKQITRQRTLFRAVQTGQATGFLAYPPVNPPIWPGALLNESPQRNITAPSDVIGNTATNWTVSWGYTFESATPLIGLPRVR